MVLQHCRILSFSRFVRRLRRHCRCFGCCALCSFHILILVLQVQLLCCCDALQCPNLAHARLSPHSSRFCCDSSGTSAIRSGRKHSQTHGGINVAFSVVTGIIYNLFSPDTLLTGHIELLCPHSQYLKGRVCSFFSAPVCYFPYVCCIGSNARTCVARVWDQ